VKCPNSCCVASGPAWPTRHFTPANAEEVHQQVPRDQFSRRAHNIHIDRDREIGDLRASARSCFSIGSGRNATNRDEARAASKPTIGGIRSVGVSAKTPRGGGEPRAGSPIPIAIGIVRFNPWRDVHSGRILNARRVTVRSAKPTAKSSRTAFSLRWRIGATTPASRLRCNDCDFAIAAIPRRSPVLNSSRCRTVIHRRGKATSNSSSRRSFLEFAHESGLPSPGWESFGGRRFSAVGRWHRDIADVSALRTSSGSVARLGIRLRGDDAVLYVCQRLFAAHACAAAAAMLTLSWVNPSLRRFRSVVHVFNAKDTPPSAAVAHAATAARTQGSLVTLAIARAFNPRRIDAETAQQRRIIVPSRKRGASAWLTFDDVTNVRWRCERRCQRW